MSRARTDPQRLFAAGVVCLVLSLSAGPSRAVEPEGLTWGRVPAQVYDLLIVRPMGFASLAAGAGFFVIAAPLTAPFGDVGAIWELYVEDPYEFTFLRPLGDVDG